MTAICTTIFPTEFPIQLDQYDSEFVATVTTCTDPHQAFSGNGATAEAALANLVSFLAKREGQP